MYVAVIYMLLIVLWISLRIGIFVSSPLDTMVRYFVFTATFMTWFYSTFMTSVVYIKKSQTD